MACHGNRRGNRRGWRRRRSSRTSKIPPPWSRSTRAAKTLTGSRQRPARRVGRCNGGPDVRRIRARSARSSPGRGNWHGQRRQTTGPAPETAPQAARRRQSARHQLPRRQWPRRLLAPGMGRIRQTPARVRIEVSRITPSACWSSWQVRIWISASDPMLMKCRRRTPA